MTSKTDARRALSPIAHIPKPPKGKAFWNPEYAECISWYPKSAEAWEAWMERKREVAKRLHRERRLGQKGIPFAWRERRDELKAARLIGEDEAAGLMRYLRADGPIFEDPRAEEALECVIAVLRARDSETGEFAESPANRLAASRMLLDFLKEKPGQKESGEVVVQRAEEWLEKLVSA